MIETELERTIDEVLESTCWALLAGAATVDPLPGPPEGADRGDTFLHYLGQSVRARQRAEVTKAMGELLAEHLAKGRDVLEAMSFGYRQQAKEAKRRAGQS